MQKSPQGRVVRGVARQHFIGEREAIRRDDQCDDHLYAIAAFVTAVAEAAFVVVVVRGRRFKIGAGQVVEQHLEFGAEQIHPALTQMGKQRLFVRQELVEAAVESILLRQHEIRAQQVCHRALFKPLPVQTPLAAGIDQPVAHQRLQDIAPVRSFARGRHAARPELVKPKLFIEFTRKPARAPLPRPMQFHRIEPHLYAVPLGPSGKPTVGRKKPQLGVALRILVKRFDRTAPIVMLAVADLTQIQQLPLHHLAIGTAPILDDVPIAVLLAVLEASIRSQKHGPTKLRRSQQAKKILGLHYTRFRSPTH